MKLLQTGNQITQVAETLSSNQSSVLFTMVVLMPGASWGLNTYLSDELTSTEMINYLPCIRDLIYIYGMGDWWVAGNECNSFRICDSSLTMILRGEQPDFFSTNAVNQSLAKSRQVRSVDVTPAPVDCELSSWSSWTACDPCQKKRVRSQALGERQASGQGWEIKMETSIQHSGRGTDGSVWP